MTKEELAAFEKEGHGRFNLRNSAEVHPAKRTRRGPRRVITNRPTRELLVVGYDRTRYRPRIVKDASGNEVRMMVKI
jgi:hypothetical protein